jgi:hypothetical protein
MRRKVAPVRRWDVSSAAFARAVLAIGFLACGAAPASADLPGDDAGGPRPAIAAPASADFVPARQGAETPGVPRGNVPLLTMVPRVWTGAMVLSGLALVWLVIRRRNFVTEGSVGARPHA